VWCGVRLNVQLNSFKGKIELIDVLGFDVGDKDERGFAFTINTKNRIFQIRAESERARSAWIDRITTRV